MSKYDQTIGGDWVAEQPDNSARLLGDRLTAGFRAKITPEEKRRKLRRNHPRQSVLFGQTIPLTREQSGLFQISDTGVNV